MEEYIKNRWSVTYTKHIKQKRKVYHDGFLDHYISTNKVKLFDDCEKLLECKILKSGEEEEEVVSSGETITFNGYLVDVLDPEGGEVDFNHKKPNLSFHCKDNNNKITSMMIHRRKKFQSPSISSSDKKDDLEQRKTLVNNLSPSKRMIREFKKNEQQRYGALHSLPDNVKTGVTEWKVLYTTQLTQKAKKYHDGFLKLTTSGSFGKQIMLYDARRELLDSRFLKNDEIIRSNGSIKFDGHLVDIGEPEDGSQPPVDLNIIGNAVNVGKNGLEHEHQDYLEDNISMAREWHVLYTSQITQKAKKYHSGIIRLASCGSYKMQVILLDEDKTILSSKFLSLSEDVKSGMTLVLPKYLVDVCEPRSPKETLNSASSRKGAGANFNIFEKEKFQDIAYRGEGPDSSCIYTVDRTETSKIAATNKSLRDIHQILSILQKPIAQERVVMECTDKNMTALVSSAKEPQVSDTKVHNPKDCQLPIASLSYKGPNEHEDNRGSCESAGIEKYTDLMPSEEISTLTGKLSCESERGISDQSHSGRSKADVKQCDEAFDFGVSSGASDHKKKGSEQIKSARKIDEWPTFELGF